ncbi:HAMP domain-containing protein [candidate division KSB1 bacterium]|nr:HAMP domain-containing protein [candidate division KSB1 bacterium]
MIRPVKSFLHGLSLKSKLISVYVICLVLGGLSITFVGSLIIDRALMHQAQNNISQDLAILKMAYENDGKLLKKLFTIYATDIAQQLSKGTIDQPDLRRVMNELDLSFIGATGGQDQSKADNDDRDSDTTNSTWIHAVKYNDESEVDISYELIDDRFFSAFRTLLIDSTATPQNETILCHVISYPIRDDNHNLTNIIYAGRILNHRYDPIDHIEDLVNSDLIELGIIAMSMGDRIIASNSIASLGKRITDYALPPEILKMVATGSTYTADDVIILNEKYITRFEPIRNAEGYTIGVFLSGISKQTYLSIRNRLMYLFLSIAAIGCVLIVFVSYIVTHHITSPLGKMVKIAQSITDGNLDQEFVVHSNDEIGQLSSSLNLMVQSLKNMRAELENWGETLTQKVKSRTEELQNIQNKIMQTECLASIGQLAAGVAHEINNPLGGILVLSSLTIENLTEDDPNRKNLEEIVKQTIRCRDIVKSLLEFSRQADAKLSRINIISVLDHTLTLLENQQIFNQITIKKIYDKDVPLVEVDESQFQQVFTNIILNAVQAMNYQGILELKIIYNKESKIIKISIEDNGKGIPREIIDKIFEPFFTTKKVGEGTGLGLSIAYGIVTKHNGRMYVNSEVGLGSTFTIELPSVE